MIVKESLLEFERGRDPRKAVGFDIEPVQLEMLKEIKKAFLTKNEKLDELIKDYAEKFGNEKTILDRNDGKDMFNKQEFNKIKIDIKKYNATEEEQIRDEFYNLYAFVGYTDFIETKSGNYKKQFTFENCVKIDRYDQHSLSSISGMKMRHNAQYSEGSSTHGEHGVYIINAPKYLMDEEQYYPQDLDKKQMDFLIKNKAKI